MLGAAIVVLVFPLRAEGRRPALRRRWSRALLRVLGIAIRVRGPQPPAGSMIVANHISWVDVFALNAVVPSAFVAKAEVRRWPLIGWLAARNDTVFLRRGSRGHARIVNAEIARQVNAGRWIALFPEGTTSDGRQVLPFHAALLQPAIEAGTPLCPLAVGYTGRDGRASRIAAYVGDTSLWASILAIVAARGLEVHLTFAEPLATAGRSRRDLGPAAREAIVAALGGAADPALREAA